MGARANSLYNIIMNLILKNPSVFVSGYTKIEIINKALFDKMNDINPAKLIKDFYRMRR